MNNPSQNCVCDSPIHWKFKCPFKGNARRPLANHIPPLMPVNIQEGRTHFPRGGTSQMQIQSKRTNVRSVRIGHSSEPWDSHQMDLLFTANLDDHHKNENQLISKLFCWKREINEDESSRCWLDVLLRLMKEPGRDEREWNVKCSNYGTLQLCVKISKADELQPRGKKIRRNSGRSI